MRQIKHSILLFSLFLLGCGFHLRGITDMPAWLNDVAIIIQQANHDLEPLLKEQLEAYHIRVCSNVAVAHYWLIIEQESEQQQITSVSSSTTPRQYQMIYTLRYKLQRAKGKEIIPSSNLVVTRQLTVNSNRILGSNDEEAILKREMRRDAVIQILDRIGNQVQ
ncbi:MAG: LPS assembly lipoprotein LptE [Legionellaceae bacterium]|nr:LPS assembly lipoprotein LptE [Legionellaceae bacterium]